MLQGTLLDYRAPPKMERAVNQTGNPASFPHYSSTMSKWVTGVASLGDGVDCVKLPWLCVAVSASRGLRATYVCGELHALTAAP